jgi:hypothetical protein
MTTRTGSDVQDHEAVTTGPRTRGRSHPLAEYRTPSLGGLPESFEVEALARRQDLLPIPVQLQSNVPRALPARAMGTAMATWLGLVFVTCYFGLPLLMAGAGLNAGVLAALPYALPAFALASFVAVVGAMVAQPKVRLDWRGRRDPVISATLGGLGVWALIHNTSALLVPFGEMTGLELVSFLGLNVLEMSLLGMMFSSFTRRHSVALALGGGFQLLLMGLVLTLMSL